MFCLPDFRPGVAGNVPGKPAPDERIAIDFDNVDIKVFIKFISKITEKNFVVDSRVRGNVTVISPEKLTRQEAYRVFESVLEINGFSVVKSGAIHKLFRCPMPRPTISTHG